MAKTRRRWRRRILVLAGGVALGAPAMWAAIHRFPWLGPALAEGARALVGPGPVAWAEDVAYGVADWINLVRHGDDKPKTFWEAPPTEGQSLAAAPVASAGAPVGPASDGVGEGTGEPRPYEPPFANVAAEGDGRWIPIVDKGREGAPPAMWKSLVHPDPKRSFAAVAIVAIDLSRIAPHMVAGTDEPKSSFVPKERRPGIVPRDHAADLVAVFNGGFRAMHGNYGMMLDGDTFVKPRDIACTIGFYKDGSIRIRTWTELATTEGEMQGYRQTPPCLVEQGSTNKALALEYNKNWGAAVGGETIIRRSALGIDASGRLLFYGLGDAVTAQSLARAMAAAGARDAAQLDVNFAYPRFLFYDRAGPGEPPKAKSGLIPDLKFTSWEYVGEPSPRDFFYLTRRHRPS